MRTLCRHSLPARRRWHGAVVLELLITLPLLVIGSMAAVEMGLWMTGCERVEMAARVGADEAATGSNLDEAVAKVTTYLSTVGADVNHLHVLVIRNQTGAPEDALTQRSPQSDAWEDWEPLLAQLPPPPESPYVRVVVRIRSDALAPNLLTHFGFDLSEQWTVRVKTLPYEGT